MNQPTKSVTKVKSQSLNLNELIPISSENDLNGLSNDELRSLVAQVSHNIQNLLHASDETPVIKFLIEGLNSLPSDIEKMSAKEMRNFLVSTIKIIDAHSLFAKSEVKAMDQSQLGSELNNIDFYKLIAGPLNAVVQAQATAAMTTVAFIKEIGFDSVDPETGHATGLRTVQFKYTKKGEGEGAESTETTIEVPLLSMVTIPSLRIQDVDITFNAKINGVEEMKSDSTFKAGAELGVKYGPVNFKATASFQRSTSMGTKVEREYTMGVKVKATQDEMPAGLEKLLNLLSA